MTNPAPDTSPAGAVPSPWTLPDIPTRPEDLAAAMASDAADVAFLATTLREPSPDGPPGEQLRRDLFGAYYALSLIAANAAAVLEDIPASPATGHALRDLLTASDNALLTCEVLTGAAQTLPEVPGAADALRSFASHTLDVGQRHLLSASHYLTAQQS
ncbi:hypothetical protein [Streptacidiphilus sp. MAP5-52]|uniref:hypothetical protein n=1 Tax=Streptacidiphilus sp. MAP5-52 TaxID=3156267 RepID=UPI003516B3ED